MPRSTSASPSPRAVFASAVDVLVIGGGITGAGIALEAARRGLSVLLAEAQDFAWGTSSRSSKLVHGGLRYLREGAIGLTRESVRERRQLLSDAPGLVEPQRFLINHYAGRSPGRGTMGLGLTVYDWLGHQHTRRFHSAAEVRELAPHVMPEGLLGGSSYLDAKTDDARLVWRVLQEARSHGAEVHNYLRVQTLLRDQHGVCGATLTDAQGASREVRARVVINATGVWADGLRGHIGARACLRPLRGSHLLFPLWRLPVAQSVSLFHPRDGRPVFAYPWEGAALVGTTDLDHRHALDAEPGITADEVDYLLEALHWAFPSLLLSADDVLSSYAGVRPVVSSEPGKDPSKETRDHIVLDEQGLITVTGGKLTTFRAIALDALRHVAQRVPGLVLDTHAAASIFASVAPGPALQSLPAPQQQRLIGRHGAHAEELVATARPGELQAVPGTAVLWAELRWAACHEAVRHLDDLLLRRTRLGLLCRGGAADLLQPTGLLRAIVQDALAWDDAQWAHECARYLDLIARCYSLPAPAARSPA